MSARMERVADAKSREGKIKGTLRCRVSPCLHIVSSEEFPLAPSKWAASSCFAAIMVPSARRSRLSWSHCGMRNADEAWA